MSGLIHFTIHLAAQVRFSSSVGRYDVPCSSVQPSLDRKNLLRGEEKKHTSRCNLGVRWGLFEPATAAIAFSRRGTCGCGTLDVIRATLFSSRWWRQLPPGAPRQEFTGYAWNARAAPVEPAQPSGCGTVGGFARVYVHECRSWSPRRPVAARCSYVSGTEKKYDLRIHTQSRICGPKAASTLYAG